MPRRRARVAAVENAVRGFRGLPPMVVRRDVVVHVPPMTARATMPAPIVGVLTGRGGLRGDLSIAGGGGVAVEGFKSGATAYAVGEAIRRRVDAKDETMYVATMAGTGGFLGAVFTGGTEWGAAIGFVSGWAVGERQRRRPRR